MAKNNELLEALNILEQEKNISKETLLEADVYKRQAEKLGMWCPRSDWPGSE